MTLSDILDNAVFKDGTLRAEADDHWKQGRTLYGGLSTALCYHAAEQALPEPRSLRSAMISFVGPSVGEVEVETELMRAGRTAASVRSRLTGEAGIGVEANFTFSTGRESKLDVKGRPIPEGAPATPSPDTQLTTPFELAPNFTKNFEWLWNDGLGPFVQTGKAYEIAWLRLKDSAQRNTLTGLLCLADALPPAVAPTMGEFAPISSMTWMIDVLVDDIETKDGWFLLEARADYASGGHCSQDMTIWNAQGDCIVKGRQMVTVFL